jgi:DNA-binding MarR family transcriptional regulator
MLRRLAGHQVPEFLGVDVTMSQAKCLVIAGLHPGISMSALAEELSVSLSAVSGLVDRLVDHGYLDRREDPSDRRQQLVTLTAEGGRVLDRVREHSTEQLRSLLQHLSRPELDSLRHGAAALDREAQRLAAEPTAARARSHERTSA